MKRRNWLTLAAIAVIACTTTVSAAESAAPAATTVKGNPDSKVYHKPDCRFYKAKSSTKEFKSEAEAVKSGYKPCKKCAAPKKEKKDKKEKKGKDSSESAK